MEGRHVFCLFQLAILYVLHAPVAVADDPLKLNWVTPPPQVVVIGHLYRVGCRIDLNKTVAREYTSLRLDDIKIWSVISKVMSSIEVLVLWYIVIARCRYIFYSRSIV